MTVAQEKHSLASCIPADGGVLHWEQCWRGLVSTQTLRTLLLVSPGEPKPPTAVRCTPLWRARASALLRLETC